MWGNIDVFEHLQALVTLDGELCGETWALAYTVTLQLISWLINLNSVYNRSHIYGSVK